MKFFDWVANRYFVWKMQKAASVLRDRTKFPPEVHAVAKAMEATLNLTRTSGNTGHVALAMSRGELHAFVQYIQRLHATKLNHLQEVKHGIVALMMKGRLSDEDIEKMKSPGGKRIIVPGDGLTRTQRRLARKDVKRIIKP